MCAVQQIVNHFCTSLIRAQERRPNHVNTLPAAHPPTEATRHTHPTVPGDREEVSRAEKGGGDSRETEGGKDERDRETQQSSADQRKRACFKPSQPKQVFLCGGAEGGAVVVRLAV